MRPSYTHQLDSFNHGQTAASKVTSHPPDHATKMSALSKLAPLLILFVVLSIFAFIGYAVYSIANDVADKTAQKMEKRHLSITKEGMVVGVKEKKEERYVDQTQRYACILILSMLSDMGLVIVNTEFVRRGCENIQDSRPVMFLETISFMPTIDMLTCLSWL